MTDRLPDQRLELEIRAFLDWQAQQVAGAPTAMEMAMRISMRSRTRLVGMRVSPPLAWVLLGGLLLLVLGSVALIGALSQRPVVDASLLSQPPVVDATFGPPTNGWIAYSNRAHTATTGVQGEIFLVRDGIERRSIGGGDGALTRCPAFSPEGTRLSYVHGEANVVLDIDATGAVSEIGRFRMNGREIHGCPIWSPAGEDIAVLSTDGIVVLRLDGSRTTLAEPDAVPDEFADAPLAWAPDGRTIAVATSEGIWLVPVDGTPPQRVALAMASSLSWSPDGSRLAFQEVGPSGRQVSVLTLASDAPAAAFLGHGEHPVWSPAGDSIAYQGDDSLLIALADGSERRPVGRPFAYGFGGWSPDGDGLLQMMDVTGSAFDLTVASTTSPRYTVIATRIQTGSSRNFPNFGDVSWQAVHR